MLCASSPTDAERVYEEPKCDGQYHPCVGCQEYPGPKVNAHHHYSNTWQHRLDEAPDACKPPRQSHHGGLQVHKNACCTMLSTASRSNMLGLSIDSSNELQAAESTRKNRLLDTYQQHHIPVLSAPILQLIHEVSHKNMAICRQEIVVTLLPDTDGPLHVKSSISPFCAYCNKE